jgi:hypothetical protein
MPRMGHGCGEQKIRNAARAALETNHGFDVLYIYFHLGGHDE